MAAKKTATPYKEPSSYFPREIRKQFELGEFNKSTNGSGGKKTASKNSSGGSGKSGKK